MPARDSSALSTLRLELGVVSDRHGSGERLHELVLHVGRLLGDGSAGIDEPRAARNDRLTAVDDARDFDRAVDLGIAPGRLGIDGDEQHVVEPHLAQEFFRETRRDDAQEMGDPRVMSPCRKAARCLRRRLSWRSRSGSRGARCARGRSGGCGRWRSGCTGRPATRELDLRA